MLILKAPSLSLFYSFENFWNKIHFKSSEGIQAFNHFRAIKNHEDPSSKVLKDEGLRVKVDICKLKLKIGDEFS